MLPGPVSWCCGRADFTPLGGCRGFSHINAGGDTSEVENKGGGKQANTANLGFLLRKGSRDTAPRALWHLYGPGGLVASSLAVGMDGLRFYWSLGMAVGFFRSMGSHETAYPCWKWTCI